MRQLNFYFTLGLLWVYRKCSSQLGYAGFGYQLTYLSHTYGVGTCLAHQVVIHELMHVIGLDHEHNRSDRDDHVSLLLENVQPSKDCFCFEIF